MKKLNRAPTFHVLNADGSFSAREAQSFKCLNEHLQSVVHDVENLLDAAASFFCGVYPLETPHCPWDRGIYLPWAANYLRPSKENPATLEHMDIASEVVKIARPLLAHSFCKDTCPAFGVTYNFVRDEEEQRTMQSLAVEVMLSVDGFLVRLPNHLPESMPWLALAYKNIIECTQQAQLILGVHRQHDAEDRAALH